MNEKCLKLGGFTLACLIGGSELEQYALPPHAEIGHVGGDTAPKEIAVTMVSTLTASGGITAKSTAPDDLTKFNLDSFRITF